MTERLSCPISPPGKRPIIQSLRVGFPAACYDCSLLRMSSFRRMPESSDSFVDTGVVSLDQESDGVRFYTMETCHEDHVPCSLSDAKAVYLIEGE